MTVKEIITKVDNMKSNSIDHEQKKEWLQQLEEQIKLEILDTHEGENREINLEDGTELIAQGPYSDLYVYYVAAQIDRINEEFDRYNNNMVLFNTAYGMFERWYHNNHMPISKGNFKV